MRSERDSESSGSDGEKASREKALAALHSIFQNQFSQLRVSERMSTPSTQSIETCTVATRHILHQSLDLFDYQEGVPCKHYALFATPGKLHRSTSESSLLINDDKEKSPRRWQY